MTLTADDIRAAAARLAGQVLDTPCMPSRTLSAITGCHVVFVPGPGNPAGKAVLQAIGDHPVLTVGESPGFLDDGGVVRLQVIDRRVRFEVNATAAERVGLRLSSQLLRLAVRVRGAV